FHTSAAGLSPSEAALLAGCLPNPRVMNPGSPNKRLRAREQMIMARMRRWGYLYEEEVLTEKKQPDKQLLDQTPSTDTATPAPTKTETTTTESTETPETTKTTGTTATSTSGSAPP